MARAQSAGTLLYRFHDAADATTASEEPETVIEVLLVHASGNYNRRAPWGIAKGLPDDGESLIDAAKRETNEETGVVVGGDLVSLGSIDYKKSRKTIHCFTAPLPADAQPRCASWEIDHAEMVSIARARELIHPDQEPFLDRLIEHLR